VFLDHQHQGKADTAIVIVRPAYVDATQAMYDWVGDQWVRLVTKEWLFGGGSRQSLLYSTAPVVSKPPRLAGECSVINTVSLPFEYKDYLFNIP
jgi:hypothetical protein